MGSLKVENLFKADGTTPWGLNEACGLVSDMDFSSTSHWPIPTARYDRNIMAVVHLTTGRNSVKFGKYFTQPATINGSAHIADSTSAGYPNSQNFDNNLMLGHSATDGFFSMVVDGDDGAGAYASLTFHATEGPPNSWASP
jgi:hypothetical protein